MIDEDDRFEDICSQKKCDGCGRYFETHELKRCRLCGKWYCTSCQQTHSCQESNPVQKKIKCDECGRYFEVSEVRSCHKCGAIVCLNCQEMHRCHSKQKSKKTESYPRSSNSRTSGNRKPIIAICVIIGVLILAGAGYACVATGTFDKIISGLSGGSSIGDMSHEFDIVGTWKANTGNLVIEKDKSAYIAPKGGKYTHTWEYLGNGLYLLTPYVDGVGSLYFKNNDNKLYQGAWVMVKESEDDNSLIGTWKILSTGSGVPKTMTFLTDGMAVDSAVKPYKWYGTGNLDDDNYFIHTNTKLQKFGKYVAVISVPDINTALERISYWIDAELAVIENFANKDTIIALMKKLLNE